MVRSSPCPLHSRFQDSKIVALETMFPYSYVSGDEDHFNEDTLTNVEQSTTTLTYYYCVEYKANTERTHEIVKGLSNVCSTEELEMLKAEDEKEPDGGNTSGRNRALLSPLHLLLAGGLILCFYHFQVGNFFGRLNFILLYSGYLFVIVHNQSCCIR
jgi:hypothetical protein